MYTADKWSNYQIIHDSTDEKRERLFKVLLTFVYHKIARLLFRTPQKATHKIATNVLKMSFTFIELKKFTIQEKIGQIYAVQHHRSS